jgi:hypothetical protein
MQLNARQQHIIEVASTYYVIYLGQDQARPYGHAISFQNKIKNKVH